MLNVILFGTNNYAIKAYEKAIPAFESHKMNFETFLHNDLKNLSANGVHAIESLGKKINNLQTSLYLKRFKISLH